VVKIILIKSPDEWATTKQACRDELVVYLCFSSHIIYIFFIAISYLTLHPKITYYLQCQRNLQFNDNNKIYNTNIIYDFFNILLYNNILHYNLLISFM